MFKMPRRCSKALRLMVCLLFLKTVAVESGFHRTPSNTVAIVGRMVKLECSMDPDETTHWTFSQNADLTSSFVFNGETVSPDFAPRFSLNVSTETGSRDLIVWSVLMPDAGIYECVLLSKGTKYLSFPLPASAQLIVLESEPHCQNNVSIIYGALMEFDFVAFRCSVNYSGHWTPTMQWSVGERTSIEIPVVIESNMSHGVQRLTSEIVLQVSAKYNGTLVVCTTGFNETSTKVQLTNATNLPSYLFHWNITLNVHYGTRNLTISPRKDEYWLEDVLTCTADGNPSPSYTWRNVGTQEAIGIGPQLTLRTTKLDANQRYTIECVAQNKVIGKVQQSFLSIDAFISDSWQLPFGYIVAAGVSIFFTLLAVFVFRFIKRTICSRESVNIAHLYKENPESSSSPDYDSIPAPEDNESPSIYTTPETVEMTENTSEVYRTLTDRPAIVQQPIVYTPLDASDVRVVLSERSTKNPPVYVNVSNE